MFTQATDDMVAFSFGKKGEFFDMAVSMSGSNYLNMRDDDTTRLKQFYYAVILHGWVTAVIPATQEQISYNAKQLAAKILQSYRMTGRNRVILLVSCYTGLGFARKLVTALNLPVLAPRSASCITPFGIFSDEQSESVRNPTTETLMSRGTLVRSSTDVLGYHVPNRPDWVFNHPNGNIEIVPGGSCLNKKAAVLLAKKYVTTD